MWAAEADEQKTVFPKRIGFRSLLGNATGNSQPLILEINTCRIRISREKIHPSFSRMQETRSQNIWIWIIKGVPPLRRRRRWNFFSAFWVHCWNSEKSESESPTFVEAVKEREGSLSGSSGEKWRSSTFFKKKEYRMWTVRSPVEITNTRQFLLPELECKC